MFAVFDVNLCLVQRSSALWRASNRRDGGRCGTIGVSTLSCVMTLQCGRAHVTGKSRRNDNVWREARVQREAPHTDIRINQDWETLPIEAGTHYNPLSSIHKGTGIASVKLMKLISQNLAFSFCHISYCSSACTNP